MFGIIGGTCLYDIEFLRGLNGKNIKTKYGDVYALQGEKFLFIPRHGKDRNIPPHRINHQANIMAFKEHGIREIIGITSVGSLKKNIPPGSLVIPDDYINFWNIPTYFDSEIVHITPSLDEKLRRRIIAIAKKLGIRIIEKGIYVQTSGPRLETRAEINFLKDYADIVGMNMASEATLAKELELRYANISSVDNYAYGITDERLDFKEILKKPVSRDLKKLLRDIIEIW